MSAATLSPASDVEVAAAISDTRAQGAALEVRGGGSVLDRLPPTDAPVLNTSGLAGIVDPAAEDLTVTVRAGTPLVELTEALASHGQECPIEPSAGAGSTVGGRIATGLAGPRQLGAGRVRDWVLRVRFVTGAGQLAAAGGATVKDVTGYDLCRLLTGSWGTIGVITEVTLKLRPVPTQRQWYRAEGAQDDLDTRLFRPTAVFTADDATHVLLEGHPDDLAAQAQLADLIPAEPPQLPSRARASVDPAHLTEFGRTLAERNVPMIAQSGVGVGYLDVAGEALRDGLTTARDAASRFGGSVLLLDPDHGLPAFGDAARPGAMAARVAAALDPDEVLAPWRWTS